MERIHLLFWKLQSLILANFFGELLSLYFWPLFFSNKFSKLLSLSPFTIRIDLSCILLMRLLAFLEENIQIKEQQLNWDFIIPLKDKLFFTWIKIILICYFQQCNLLFSTLGYLEPEASSNTCGTCQMIRQIQSPGIVKTVYSSIFKHI